MMTFFLALVLLGLSLLGIALRKAYSSVPRKELKRLARSGDRVAAVMYRAVAYGPNLRALLWIWIVLTLAAGTVLLVRVAPAYFVVPMVAALLWYGFSWMPANRITSFGLKTTLAATPVVAWLLGRLHPLLSRLTDFLSAHRPVTFHTGLYDREDLVELLELQRQIPDGRIPPEELDLLLHALSFGDITVREVMVPRRVVTMAAETEVVGPILMKELHDSGHSRFPVYSGSKDVLSGTLYLRDLLEAKQGGTVKQIARPEVYYVHEDAALYQVLDAFIKTKHHLFIVVNNFEEFVGIITIEDILEQVIGRKIQDEFDKYDDIRAVAASQANKERKARKPVSETVVEVVE